MASTSRSLRRIDQPRPEVLAPVPCLRRSHAGRRQCHRVWQAGNGVNGLPHLDSLRPVLGFLVFPFALVLLNVFSDGLPTPLLFGCGAVLGLYLLASIRRGPELIVACTLFYLPFSSTHVMPLGPGINGTNLLLFMAVVATLWSSLSRRDKWIHWLPGTTIVAWFGVLSALSGITVMGLPDGLQYLLSSELLTYKGWLEQFLFIGILMSAIRDQEMAKRFVIYLSVGAVALVIYAIPEMFAKMGLSNFDESRLVGPHQQANNFGGFVAYTLLVPAAIFMVFIKDLRAWLLTPYFLLALKILLATFSRGAYLAMAVGGLLASYLRGKGFMLFWGMLGLSFLLVFPQFIPDSVAARIQSLIGSGDGAAVVRADELDKSSLHRLILWEAAVDMIAEDPLTGKGFKAFQRLKSRYTATDVPESDPHNMYLYLASQMGIPVLLLFVCILLITFHSGRVLSQRREDRFVQATGIGGAAAAACVGAVCMFGSRAVNLEFTAYFWTLFVVLQVLRFDPSALDRVSSVRERHTPIPSKSRRRMPWSGQKAGIPTRKSRTNAFLELDKTYRDDADREAHN